MPKGSAPAQPRGSSLFKNAAACCRRLPGDSGGGGGSGAEGQVPAAAAAAAARPCRAAERCLRQFKRSLDTLNEVSCSAWVTACS